LADLEGFSSINWSFWKVRLAEVIWITAPDCKYMGKCAEEVRLVSGLMNIYWRLNQLGKMYLMV